MLIKNNFRLSDSDYRWSNSIANAEFKITKLQRRLICTRYQPSREHVHRCKANTTGGQCSQANRTHFCDSLQDDPTFAYNWTHGVRASFSSEVMIKCIFGGTATIDHPTIDPPTIYPPTIDPSTINSPTIDPPTIDPPTIDPPTIDPPKIDPPTIDPPKIDPPTIDPLTIDPSTIDPPTLIPRQLIPRQLIPR